MSLNKVALTALALEIFGAGFLFAAGNSHDDLREQQEASAELARESSEQWFKRMARIYITAHIYEPDRSSILQVLSQTPVESQEWVERIAKTLITYAMFGHERCLILDLLSRAAVKSQEWLERIAKTYSTHEMSGANLCLMLKTLIESPVDSQVWIERMAPQIMPLMVISHQFNILSLLIETPVESQGWVERMAQAQTMPILELSRRFNVLKALIETPVDRQVWVERMVQAHITHGVPHRFNILKALIETPVESQGWVEHLMTFLHRHISPSDIGWMIGFLGELAKAFNTPALLEQARVRFVEQVNGALEDGPITDDILMDISCGIIDKVTEEAEINPNNVSCVEEVHFAAALEVLLK